jgi:hypothetical protein
VVDKQLNLEANIENGKCAVEEGSRLLKGGHIKE